MTDNFFVQAERKDLNCLGLGKPNSRRRSNWAAHFTRWNEVKRVRPRTAESPTSRIGCLREIWNRNHRISLRIPETGPGQPLFTLVKVSDRLSQTVIANH